MQARPDLDTQVKIARGAGVSQSTVGRVLAAEVHTNLDVLESLARAYRIHPLALLSDPSQMTQPDAMAAGYQERQLLAAWRLLSPAQQHAVMGYIEVASLGAGALLGGSVAPAAESSQADAVGQVPDGAKAAVRRAAGRQPSQPTEQRFSNDDQQPRERARPKRA